MPDPTYIACPRCGEPYAMTAMQKRLYHGRTLTCQRCAKPFAVTEQTPDPVPAHALRLSGSPVQAPQAPAAGQSALAVDPPAQEEEPAPVARSWSPTSKATDPDDPGEGLTAGRMALLIAVLAVVIGGLLYVAIAPGVHRSREATRRVTCGSNLTQVGVALQFYASANGGRYPDTLAALVANGSLPPELLVCPSSRHSTAPGATPAEQAANLANGSHQSYVYVGQGLTMNAPKQVIVYEPLDHHDGEGVNVLYTDGSMQFLSRAGALAAVPQLAPATFPAATTQAAPAR
jgi:uncharacterized protein YbaR (Trm112 family)